jgi:hypothetical protein
MRKCLARCRHCGIFFMTDPRNAGRRDLGCPFGCREAHRKQRSTQRSIEYYREKEGKVKKKALNGKRRVPARRCETPAKDTDRPESRPDRRPGSCRLPPPMVEHVRRVVSLIEGRRVGTPEILAMLERVLRQHSMVGRRKRGHVLRQLNENPP